MLLLGLETSCDETAASVVRDGRTVLASVVASQAALHEEYAGVVPEIASRAHVEAVLPTLREALAQAGVGLGMIDAVCVGHRPGLIGSLLVGVSAAKALAWSLGRPLVGVDHVHAHLYAGLLENPEASGSPLDPAALFPALGLVVSGGHTSLYHMDSWTRLTRLGATIDDAMGEAYDKAATILGLTYPGGPNLDRLANEPGGNDHAIDFPISRLSRESLDFSFSGLKTAMLYAARGVPATRGKAAHPAPELTLERKRDLAASFQRAAVRAATIKVERALDAGKVRGVAYRTLLTGGGVTANSRLRAELTALAHACGITLSMPQIGFCVDNAAMIAGLGYHLLLGGHTHDLSLEAAPTTAT